MTTEIVADMKINEHLFYRIYIKKIEWEKLVPFYTNRAANRFWNFKRIGTTSVYWSSGLGYWPKLITLKKQKQNNNSGLSLLYQPSATTLDIVSETNLD